MIGVPALALVREIKHEMKIAKGRIQAAKEWQGEAGGRTKRSKTEEKVKTEEPGEMISGPDAMDAGADGSAGGDVPDVS
eukprot:3955265-Karenia_brevis.AAC.1